MPDARTGFAALPHRRALGLAIPAIASNVAVPLVGLIDTAVVGHFGTTADVGAVGLGAAVVASVFWAFAFLRPATTSLVGRALGGGLGADAIRHLQRALGLAVAMGLAWAAVQWVVVPGLVRLLAGESQSGALAAQYALVRGLSLPGVLVTLAIIGYFIGAQDTRTPLVIAATVAGINVGLTVWFVAGLGGGAVGSAWATFGAEWAGAVLAIVLLRRRLGAHDWRALRRWRDPALRTGWRSLMSMNSHLVMRTALLMSAVTVTAAWGSRISAEVLAANAILLQMMYLASYALDGYATAAETMAAREIGRRDVTAFHRANLATTGASALIAVALSVTFWWGGGVIVSVLTGLPEVATTVEQYWWVAIALPLVSFSAWLLDGIFLGTGRSRDMVVSMAVSVVGVFALTLVIAGALDSVTNTVLWCAFLAMNVARAITLGVRYIAVSRAQGWVVAA